MKNNPEAIKHYDEQMGEWERKYIDSNYSDKVLEDMSQFQLNEMTEWLSDFDANYTGKYEEIIHDLMGYVINSCESGTSSVCLSDYFDEDKITEDLATDVAETIWDVLGEFLLEYPDVYEDFNDEGSYDVDCNFGGFYTPHWDGWGSDYSY